jgi:drug/metabolite transporter (DMT)-like permease
MSTRLRYSIIMFIAGSCYGIVVPLVRTAYAAGFGVGEVMVTQYLIAALLLVVVVVVFSRRHMTLKEFGQLLCVGVVASGVSFCYFRALDLLPSATALTLLFQFVWIGVVIQIVRERKLPKPLTVFAVVLVMIGAVLATGATSEVDSFANLDPLGVLFGFLSALFYALFLFLSGRVAVDLPAVNRTLVSVTASFLVAFTLCPLYFAKPMLLEMPLLGLVLGIVGICLPVFLIAVSAPKLPPGLATIMASSELPSGVICATIFLGDPLTLPVAGGVVIVLLGIVLSELENLRLSAKEHKLDKD